VRNSLGQEKANFEPHRYKHSQGIRSGDEEAVPGSTHVLDQVRAGFKVGFYRDGRIDELIEDDKRFFR
jgi:hypothetical protein